MQREIEGHQPRVDEVLDRGRCMVAAAEGTPEAKCMSEEMEKLKEVWARLDDEMAKRRARLISSNDAQQYYNDADEAEAWIGEQELYMIADENAKVSSLQIEFGDQSAMFVLYYNLCIIIYKYHYAVLFTWDILYYFCRLLYFHVCLYCSYIYSFFVS